MTAIFNCIFKFCYSQGILQKLNMKPSTLTDRNVFLIQIKLQRTLKKLHIQKQKKEKTLKQMHISETKFTNI